MQKLCVGMFIMINGRIIESERKRDIETVAHIAESNGIKSLVEGVMSKRVKRNMACEARGNRLL